jgi:uncharacterized protein YpiB (UPF0302 family)
MELLFPPPHYLFFEPHRYYITKMIIDTVEVEYNDSVINMNYYEYKSKYVGKNIDEALIKLLLLC